MKPHKTTMSASNLVRFDVSFSLTCLLVLISVPLLAQTVGETATNLAVPVANEQPGVKNSSHIEAESSQGKNFKPRDRHEWTLEEVKSAADNQDVEAQCVLAQWHEWGANGLPKNAPEAFKWWQKAAESGLADAKCNIGRMFATGEGVKKDLAEAVIWYRRAAEQGSASAQAELGAMCELGIGTERDDVEALKWYRKAADQGLVSAQYNLGVMLENGRGVQMDKHEAVNWFSKAAKGGYGDAQEALKRLGAPSTVASETQAATINAKNYGDLVIKAQTFVKRGSYLEANSAAVEAISLDPNRFEAYLVAASAQSKSGRAEQARILMEQAIQKAPPDKKEKLAKLADELSGIKPETQFVSVESLNTDARRKYDALLFTIQDADQARNAGTRYRLLNEFLTNSTTFLQKTSVAELWALRAGVALEMDDAVVKVRSESEIVLRDEKPWKWLGYSYEKLASIGWSAGKKLVEHDVSNPKIHDLLVRLERKGWMGEQDPFVVAEAAERQRESARLQLAEKKRLQEAEAIQRKITQQEFEFRQLKRDFCKKASGTWNTYLEFVSKKKRGVGSLVVDCNGDNLSISLNVERLYFQRDLFETTEIAKINLRSSEWVMGIDAETKKPTLILKGNFSFEHTGSRCSSDTVQVSFAQTADTNEDALAIRFPDLNNKGTYRSDVDGEVLFTRKGN